MAVKAVLKPPLTAPGAKVADFLRCAEFEVKSDDVLYNDTSPVSLFDVVANTLVLGVIVEVATAFNGTIPSLSIGVSGTAARHAATTDVDLKATGFTTVNKPHEYTADATIIGTIVGSGASAGKFRVWLRCRHKSNVQVP